MSKRILILIVISVFFLPLRGESVCAELPSLVLSQSGKDIPPPTVFPEMIDLGTIRPAEEAKGVFYTKNTDTVNQEWFVEAPEGWQAANEDVLSGLVIKAPDTTLALTLRCIKVVRRSEKKYAFLVLRMKAGGRSLSLSREAPLGKMRVSLQFNYVGGTKEVFFTVQLAELSDTPVLELDSSRIDFGKVRAGEVISQRIHLTNGGKAQLKWKVRVASTGQYRPDGRYVSFRRVLQEEPSVLIGRPRDGLELYGKWNDKDGYPEGRGEQTVLKYQFSGTGITVHLWRSQDGGVLSAFLDGQFVNVIDGYAQYRENAEIPIAYGQTDGPHVLTIVCGEGTAVFDGVTVLGRSPARGPRGWVSVFPDSGVTTRETDYINISVNTRGILPGTYGNSLLISSNGGDVELQFFLDVVSDKQSKEVEVHRYFSGSDCLLTSTPKEEAARIKARGYRYGGIAFRLFSPGTPGTTELLRWFNPRAGDHFYSYNPDSIKHLSGYIFEGSIGNIGTSKLSGTRELYRWVNDKTNHHFYTTDQSGEGMAKKGYRFDGIAGFVQVPGMNPSK